MDQPSKVRPHFQTVVPEQAVSADGVGIYELGVNPISVIYLMLRPLNNSGTLANYARYLNLLAGVVQLRVLYRGQSIVSMSGVDIAALNLLRRNVEPRDCNPYATDNVRRAVCLPVFLGRFAADSMDCFPAARRGDLQLEIQWDVAATGFDDMRFSVSTLELLNAAPVSYERCVTISRTFNAVGPQDIALPRGWEHRGILLWGTTGFLGAAPAPSFGDMSLMIDNQQYWAANMSFEEAMVMNAVLGGRQPYSDSHQHTSAASGSPTTNGYDLGTGGWEKYGFMDFDLSRNDAYSVATATVNDVQLRCVAETANSVRVTPVERVLVAR